MFKVSAGPGHSLQFIIELPPSILCLATFYYLKLNFREIFL